MKILKSIALAATTLVLSTSVNAAIINADWLSVGDNLITLDTANGLEWLDLTVTADRSYNDISSKLGTGQEFEGWRYATIAEVSGFWDAFGGDSLHYDGLSSENNGLFDLIAPYWGDLYCSGPFVSCLDGEGYSEAMTVVHEGTVANRVKLWDLAPTQESIAYDDFNLSSGGVWVGGSGYTNGSALVRGASVVPVPAAVWLFGSGLIGLIGVARRKNK